MAAHTRRAFFGWLGVLTVGMVLDPERALWVPGRRTYFDFPRHRTVSEIFEEELVAYFMGVALIGAALGALVANLGRAQHSITILGNSQYTLAFDQNVLPWNGVPPLCGYAGWTNSWNAIFTPARSNASTSR